MNKVKTSRTNWFWLIVFTLFFINNAAAQKQANHWFTPNYHFDFNNNQINYTSLPIPMIPSNGHRYASISDQEGNLLFVTNLRTVYDRNYNPMPNGETGLIYVQGFDNGSHPIIIPQPGSDLYYLFLPNDTSSTFDFVMVDMSKNNGLGDVVQKARNLPLATDGAASTGNCEIFWFFTTQRIPDTNHMENRLIRYNITDKGLGSTPDTLLIDKLESYYNLRFSSDGKKVAFQSYFGNYNLARVKIVLCDFDMEHGTFNNPISLYESYGQDYYEFSPDNSKLYIAEGSSFTNSYALLQFDISTDDIDSIKNSKLLLYQGNDEFWINRLILSPLGQIICEQASTTGTSKSALIRYPNKKGLACGFELNALSFTLFGDLPNFVSTFLGPNFDADFIVNAGEDMETCTDIPIPLGQETNYGIQYEWQPGNYLSSTTLPNPNFLYTDTISVETDFTYILDGKKGYCEGADTVTITVHPDKQTPIFGSKSVCPGVSEVDYWAEADERFSYEWSTNGGDIVVAQNTDSIKVNWGVTNPSANVTLVPYNKLDCPSDPIIFPVRINVELQTETPVGDELLCSNLATEIPYAITNTNGSVYTWESDYGAIVAGQGANEITIDWPGDGKYTLWVKEQSATVDTVCYGVSDSLPVNLFTDSTRLEIDFASVSEEDANSYELQWYANDTSRISKEIAVYSSLYASNWELIHSTTKSEKVYQFPDTIMNYAPLSFKIASVNGCEEHIESEAHTVMHLEGIADSSLNTMRINWTPYIGWANNIEQYEIWYKRDEENGYGLVASFKPDQLQWTNNWGANAFEHYFRIRALHSSYPFESWSNELKLEFKHEIEIPNVFTPNGDGINETFSFPNLELFHDNELIIIDRNGKEVFAKNDYTGDWTGHQLSSGIYYYSFHAKRNNRLYKGWVQILK